MHVRSTKVLLELDEGLLSLVDAEAVGGTRLATIRMLLVEALEGRARDRGEELPRIEPWTPELQGTWRPGIDYGTDESIRTSGQAAEVTSLGKEIISVKFSENKTVIRSRPVRTAHEVVTSGASITAGDPQTPSEARIEGLKK